MDYREQALDQLGRAAYRLSAADARLRGRATRSADALSLTHARALRVLAEQGPSTVSQLAAGTETTSAGVTQLVNGLVQAGYVTRQRSATDQRSVTVALTDKGADRHAKRSQALTEALDEAFGDLDEQELARAARVLGQLVEVYDRL
ncbi:hypothetical protein GCM10010174_74180 [Kutzneria viridogrisea]|uniref:HTH marR-type domain-containing protein n=2 Tax=Kutzneria TaxID=43356 RepID=W5W856_9PSEU|nr:MarR family transcriptional regulator [Kutzneria albida]AHH96925.1 hypothetical protein KALB_3561 [Kutzneria albida DSM 43870]MBA8927853.1 DNA-binding MarR family transcriptional regulator [Kutzneria viridogrisea]